MSDTEPEENETKGLAEPIDWAGSVQNFAIDTVTSFIYVFIISIVAVNILFYVKGGHGDVAYKELFPIEPTGWPYCYTEKTDFAKCPTKGDDGEFPEQNCGKGMFGDLHKKTPEEGDKWIKPHLLSAAIFLEKLCFKAFCLTEEQHNEVNKAADDSTQATLLNGVFMMGRLKQWLNNTTVYHFTTSRYFLVKVLDFVKSLQDKIPKELKDYIEPFMVIIGFFIFLLLCIYFLFGIISIITFVAMIKNQTQDKSIESTSGGGFLWTSITGGGFFGLVPMVIFIIQMIQFVGTFVLYPPLANGEKYGDIYATYVPIIFFVLNIVFMINAFIHFTPEVALIITFSLFALLLSVYYQPMTEFKEKFMAFLNKPGKTSNFKYEASPAFNPEYKQPRDRQQPIQPRRGLNPDLGEGLRRHQMGEG